MIKIEYNFSHKCYDPETGGVRISTDEHNNLYLDTVSGMIKFRTIPTPTNTLNTPGNGIDGTVGQTIPIIRLNNSVSRKVAGDPTSENEGVVIPDLLEAYFNSLGV